MNISELKGQKKLEAIENLGNDPQNISVLMALAQTEKKEYKEMALLTLGKFHSEEALPLWQSIVKAKGKNERVLYSVSSPLVGDLVGEAFLKYLQKAIKKAEVLNDKEWSEFKAFFSASLGKFSPKMLDLYRFLAAEEEQIFPLLPIEDLVYVEKGAKRLQINEFLRIYKPSSEDKKAIFPYLLTLSLIKQADMQGILLANELQEAYGGRWLIPKFVASLLTESAEQVYADFSPFWGKEEGQYLVDALGLLYFSEKDKTHQAVAKWGDHEYGVKDTRTAFYAPLKENLSEKWFSLLAKYPQKAPFLQIYYAKGVGGVMYRSFDQLFADILCYPIENEAIKNEVIAYFLQQEEAHNGQGTTYITILNYLQQPITEKMVLKWINCEDNAVSEYSIPPLLNNCTAWSKEQKLNFYQNLPSKLQNKEEMKKLKG